MSYNRYEYHIFMRFFYYWRFESVFYDLNIRNCLSLFAKYEVRRTGTGKPMSKFVRAARCDVR